jgi:hypothetical protein
MDMEKFMVRVEEERSMKRKMMELLCYAHWIGNMFPKEIKKLGRKELRIQACYSGRSRILKVDFLIYPKLQIHAT